MSTRKELGKICKVSFGLGGYQDCCLGLSLTFEGKSWGVGHFIGAWDPESIKCDSYCKWTEKDRSEGLDDTMRKLSTILKKAKVDEVSKLFGIPVEVEFDGQLLKTWRILEEVL